MVQQNRTIIHFEAIVEQNRAFSFPKTNSNNQDYLIDQFDDVNQSGVQKPTTKQRDPLSRRWKTKFKPEINRVVVSLANNAEIMFAFGQIRENEPALESTSHPPSGTIENSLLLNLILNPLTAPQKHENRRCTRQNTIIRPVNKFLRRALDEIELSDRFPGIAFWLRSKSLRRHRRKTTSWYLEFLGANRQMKKQSNDPKLGFQGLFLHSLQSLQANKRQGRISPSETARRLITNYRVTKCQPPTATRRPGIIDEPAENYLARTLRLNE
ncbi:hypothetical protein WN51_12703 [Melipona quadrifasciata]|uniref:Uncharacterized protein n=1 Tax=Melipona quadrifasciata TaxID=166423 RepID=A0A0N0BGM2_9HYME|nr:hypothetical protein WN51_12703 [Melipona quadrifasciata]